MYSFNTASGKYYCNMMSGALYRQEQGVSIPQAVSTIAIYIVKCLQIFSYCFNTASGKYYCNQLCGVSIIKEIRDSFNTASGKYYCN